MSGYLIHEDDVPLLHGTMRAFRGGSRNLRCFAFFGQLNSLNWIQKGVLSDVKEANETGSGIASGLYARVQRKCRADVVGWAFRQFDLPASGHLSDQCALSLE